MRSTTIDIVMKGRLFRVFLSKTIGFADNEFSIERTVLRRFIELIPAAENSYIIAKNINAKSFDLVVTETILDDEVIKDVIKESVRYAQA